MKKRDEIKRILTEYAEQQQNRSGGGAFGRAESPRLAKTLDQYAAEIEELCRNDCQSTGIGSQTEYQESTT